MIYYIEKQMYSFLWNGKPDKVKRSSLIQTYDKGGLKMIDIDKFIQAQKITWIKRILDPNNKNILNEIYLHRLKEPGQAKTCLMPYANSKGADKPAHPRSLISTFVVRCLDSMISILAISKVSRF